MAHIEPTLIAVVLLFAAGHADAECRFVTLKDHLALGQSLKHITERLGSSGYSRLPNEDGWSFEKPEFKKLGVIATRADIVWFGTYKDIVFKSNLRYATRNLRSARVDLVGQLDACARRLSADCWQDELENYYQIGNDSKDTYLYITAPRFGSPDDTDLPPRSCR